MQSEQESLLESWFGGDIVRGWRNIAREIGTCERTARSYGKEYGLPFHYSATGGVWALKFELRSWLFFCSFLKKARKENKINCSGLGCVKLLSGETLFWLKF